MIECFNLTKRFGTKQAVNALNLKLDSGELFGFLGLNGAGKTTTIRMLMGQLVPTSGTVSMLGLDAFAHRAEIMKSVGYLADTPQFYGLLRARENLEFVAEMRGFKKSDARRMAAEQLERFDLSSDAEQYVMNFSLGMTKRLGFAAATMHKPRVLIFDEPWNGLDPRGARDIQDLILEHTKSGGVAFVSTHTVAVAERLCSRVGVLHRGELVAMGSVTEVIGTHPDLEASFFALTSTSAIDQVTAESEPADGT